MLLEIEQANNERPVFDAEEDSIHLSVFGDGKLKLHYRKDEFNNIIIISARSIKEYART